MAQECTDSSSVAISSSTQLNWWDLHHGNCVSSWTNSSPWQQPNPSSNSSCEEDVSVCTSFTNASNHSGLTVESSRRLVETTSNDLIGEHASDSQLWSHLLLGIGSNGDLHSSQDFGENSLHTLSSKSLSSSGILFEQHTSDYLNKTNSNLEFTNFPSLNNFEKHVNTFTHTSLIENEKVSKLSNLVSNWSIAPPDPEVNNDLIEPLTGSMSLSSSTNHFSQPQTYSDSSCLLSCNVGQGIKVENENRDNIEAPGTFFRRSFNGHGFGHELGLNNSSVIQDSGKYYYGAIPRDGSSTRNFNDVIALNSRFSKPLLDIQVPKACFKSLNLSDYRKQRLVTSSPTGRGQGTTNEGKKKRSGDTSDTVLKKPKHENSVASSVKVQVPKVKLGDRITALQQIVSPFGKTDTASVLYEAIQYIKFLQEQVQLLISNPHMKTSPHKDPWGGLERKGKGDVKVDLRSKGLCLVPISCTPQVYHESTGTDYWTPTYRGCLYR